MAFISIIFGGTAGLVGPVIGGVCLGLLQVALRTYLPESILPFQLAFSYLVVICVLVRWPDGREAVLDPEQRQGLTGIPAAVVFDRAERSRVRGGEGAFDEGLGGFDERAELRGKGEVLVFVRDADHVDGGPGGDRVDDGAHPRIDRQSRQGNRKQDRSKQPPPARKTTAVHFASTC